ncbi:hypothetical protein [uncultured Gammaproteobacteria bacterium]|uniref:hypothetical protein n=1 Tax=Bathymodiolus heckerae thiotrophic gill symbiont TaxID=1052212 RepID=UPI0010B2E8AF|nr:hypothetical protein [Bathymodiolus heckerae thiotrophic gill symbiont]CAC9599820.1 hypothetical protein [uncultured Gammaproteobacteria bacterium]CAC9963624.1 hypothetical protein [uncultured Gammaproteobacteria bacterium]CAC9965225.1 hypothetical protein [uncultured Gammaproteobacteria bacterium]SHN91222.1 hypothetical protein BHECKSOX_1462 [Bathymodiolus heckerae thiotrophic gill symbiont]
MTELKFFEKLDLIDVYINSVDKVGHEKAFKKIETYLESPAICRYFFEEITDKEWVNVVLNSEFFKVYRTKKLLFLEDYQLDRLFC